MDSRAELIKIRVCDRCIECFGVDLARRLTMGATRPVISETRGERWLCRECWGKTTGKDWWADGGPPRQTDQAEHDGPHEYMEKLFRKMVEDETAAALKETTLPADELKKEADNFTLPQEGDMVRDTDPLVRVELESSITTGDETYTRWASFKCPQGSMHENIREVFRILDSPEQIKDADPRQPAGSI